LHPTLGKREKTFGAVPPSPKKVFLVFPPVVTKAILNISTTFEICSQHTERREITFIQLKSYQQKVIPGLSAKGNFYIFVDMFSNK
jgi:hypothetical protein